MTSSVDPNRSLPATMASDSPSHRPLPATGLPASRQSRRTSAVVSVLAHLLIIALLIRPIGSHEGEVVARAQGAGGAGPAGGGGGGHNGTGGIREHVEYVRVAPAPAPSTTSRATVPKVVQHVVPPAVAPPKPVPPPTIVAHPAVMPPASTPITTAPAASKIAESPISGVGGGTGRDGAGNGPGSGGGVGSGIGTGRGSGTGPGTGGGTQANYPPTTVELFIPPLPIPGKVHGFHGIAEFDVDANGKVLGFTFTPTKDGSYNRLLEDVFKRFKFRPGTTPDGTPIRMKVQIPFELG